MVNLPDDWQDNFTGADNLKCLTLYPSEDDLRLLRKQSGRDKESISAIVRKAVHNYLQKMSWGVNLLPQAALKRKSCRQFLKAIINSIGKARENSIVKKDMKK